MPAETKRETVAPVRSGPAAARARGCLERLDQLTPERRYGDLGNRDTVDDALATCLMEAYRQTRDAEAFDALADVSRPRLLRRVRTRLHVLGIDLDPQEVLQDTLVNVFRYPDKFDGSRPGAFRAWVSMILDNVIRRSLRSRRSALDVAIVPDEILAHEADHDGKDPALRAERGEECRRVHAAMAVLLHGYLDAFESLSERERHVLEEVEVHGKRYAEIEDRLGARPEALKMVVFRARRRIHERLQCWFREGLSPQDAAGGTRAVVARRDAAA